MSKINYLSRSCLSINFKFFLKFNKKSSKKPIKKFPFNSLSKRCKFHFPNSSIESIKVWPIERLSKLSKNSLEKKKSYPRLFSLLIDF